jgi:hypothetical protein
MIVRPPPRLTNRALIDKYIQIDLFSWMKDVTSAITKINFQDNFQSFTVNNISILAGMEVGISNQFKNRYPGTIPTGRIIIRQKGDANIIDGDSDWTEDLVFLKNPSANDAIVSVIFFK